MCEVVARAMGPVAAPARSRGSRQRPVRAGIGDMAAWKRSQSMVGRIMATNTRTDHDLTIMVRDGRQRSAGCVLWGCLDRFEADMRCQVVTRA